MVSVRTSIVPPRPCPPLADTPGTSPAVTTPQVTASIHDFAGSLARYHRAFDNIDAARIQETTMAGMLHPAAAKVIATLNNEWDGLRRHRDLPFLDLDNNGAERALRTPVIGRKNFYGSGAAWAAHLAAGIWTITATAAQNDTEPLHLLTDYLTACAENGGKPLTGGKLDPFLPWTPAGRARRTAGSQHDAPDDP